MSSISDLEKLIVGSDQQRTVRWNNGCADVDALGRGKSRLVEKFTAFGAGAVYEYFAEMAHEIDFIIDTGG